MRPLLRVVPPAEWALATDSEAEHIAFFTDGLGQLALATSALGLGLTVADGTGRVAASAGDLGVWRRSWTDAVARSQRRWRATSRRSSTGRPARTNSRWTVPL